MNYILFPDLPQIRASNCGISILNPGWIHPNRKLSTSVLILGRKSQAEIIEENTSLIIEPDTFVLLPAERNHYGTKPITHTTSYFWMHFETSSPPVVLPEKEALSILRNPNSHKEFLANSIILPQQITTKDPKMFQESFHDLLYEQERPSFTGIKMQLLFQLLLITLTETVLSEINDKNYDESKYNAVYLTIQTIHENLTHTNFSVKSLSEHVQYNPDYLGRIFKTRIGKSISEYINDQRIKYAVCLLIETNNTIDSIAYDSGFNSTRNFLRQFKVRKGETPSDLRQKNRQMHITNR